MEEEEKDTKGGGVEPMLDCMFAPFENTFHGKTEKRTVVQRSKNNNNNN